MLGPERVAEPLFDGPSQTTLGAADLSPVKLGVSAQFMLAQFRRTQPAVRGTPPARPVVCGEPSSLGVSVVALDHVSSTIIDDCAVSSEVGGYQPDD